MYSIAAVAARCTVSVATLRNWEVKYEVVTPHRTAGGHRAYDAQDLARLYAMARLVRTGWTPRAAAAEVIRRAADGVCPVEPACQHLATCEHAPSAPPPAHARIRVTATALTSPPPPPPAATPDGSGLEARLDEAVSALASTRTLPLAPVEPRSTGCPLWRELIA